MARGVVYSGSRAGGGALQRIAQSIGVNVFVRGKHRVIGKSADAIFAEVSVKLLGRGLGKIPEGTTIRRMDEWLRHEAATYLGKHGWVPQTHQRCMREARNARAKAIDLYLALHDAVNRRGSGTVAAVRPEEQAEVWEKIEEHRKEVAQWFELARIAKEMQETEAAMKAGGIDITQAERATRESLREQS